MWKAQYKFMYYSLAIIFTDNYLNIDALRHRSNGICCITSPQYYEVTEYLVSTFCQDHTKVCLYNAYVYKISGYDSLFHTASMFFSLRIESSSGWSVQYN